MATTHFATLPDPKPSSSNNPSKPPPQYFHQPSPITTSPPPPQPQQPTPITTSRSFQHTNEHEKLLTLLLPSPLITPVHSPDAPASSSINLRNQIHRTSNPPPIQLKETTHTYLFLRTPPPTQQIGPHTQLQLQNNNYHKAINTTDTTTMNLSTAAAQIGLTADATLQPSGPPPTLPHQESIYNPPLPHPLPPRAPP